ncbi:MAG TPA: hypothetical protein PLW93_06190, partial [Candidatus Absconditabacterales bacterium]|nr:hypothetical protein [Candidatus Absconditabacterales bacterium]
MHSSTSSDISNNSDNTDTSSNYSGEYSDNYNIDISNRAKQYKVVYDLEQLSNFHSCTALDYRTQTVYLFVIHESRNDIVSYINFLERCVVMSGYNNINYDYPMLHYILTNKDTLVLLTPQQINKILYAESQRIIDSGKLAGSTGFKKRTIPANQIIIPQLDLMAINSLTNEARRASLKQLQFAMRGGNLQEMPIHHYSVVKTEQV